MNPGTLSDTGSQDTTTPDDFGVGAITLLFVLCILLFMLSRK